MTAFASLRRSLVPLLWLALILSLMLAARPALAHGDSLASVRQAQWPAPPAAPQALLSVDNRLLALSGGQAWWLDAQGREWQAQALDWSAEDRVIGATGGAAQPGFVLVAGAQAPELLRRVDRLSVAEVSAGSAASRLQRQPLAPLPQPLRQARATLLADGLLVAGLSADGQPQLLRLRHAQADAAWEALPAWPGGGQPLAMVGQTGALFLAVGAAESVAEAATTGRQLRWSADKGWTEVGPLPGRLLSPNARPTGQAHAIYLVAGQGGAAQLMSFQTITGSWAVLAPVAGGSELRPAAAWATGLAWAAPGATMLDSAEIEAGKLMLKWLDWAVILVYLFGMLGMGLYFYLREKRNSTSDFFVGGRSIPFWAAGVSLYAANTSSISYIAIPAKAFETNWQYLTNNLVAVLGLMFVAVWIVPLLRRLDLMSVFSYLETRFHPSIRMLSSALCILVQLGSRMSVILFLPSLAIATITGLDVVWSILLMGGFTIVYTALGGMKAVVWTDVVQLVVKMGGALFAIGFIIWQLDGGMGEFVKTATQYDKTKLFDFSFDLTKATVWGFVFLVLFDVVLTFPKDQVLMQRTLSTKSDKDAGRAIWAFALIMIPGGFVFYSIGTALFVYYKANPERMNPLLSIDATFPMFIAAELPTGLTGLIIAGIFAAAMATLSSIMNSVATLASVDFYEKLVKNPDPKKSVLFAEVMTVLAGLIGMGFALLLSRYDIHSLFDVSIELAGLLGGGFAGAYTLGMFTRRANSQGVAIGVASAIVLTTIAWAMKLVHPYFYLAISILLCIVIGYLASLLFPPPTRSLKGLTIYKDD